MDALATRLRALEKSGLVGDRVQDYRVELATLQQGLAVPNNPAFVEPTIDAPAGGGRAHTSTPQPGTLAHAARLSAKPSRPAHRAVRFDDAQCDAPD